MKNKLKKCVICLLLIGFGVLIGSLSSKKETALEEKTFVKKDVNTLSMMLETEANSGNYELTTRNEWPTEGYVFNPDLSVCEHGGKLSWDDENKRILMSGNMSDKCYVYFDVYVPLTLAEYIKSQYTGIQGENEIYYHDGSMKNGINDDSYRYSGANPSNFICLGSIDATCPDANLFRIIGVFEDKVKVISAKSVGNVYWDNNGLNTWSTSSLNTYLNKDYYSNLSDALKSKIATATWKVGGTADMNVISQTAKVAYQNEVVNLTSGDVGETEYSAKVGLMYASDYGFAAAPSAWTKNLYDYDGIDANNLAIKNYNWLYLNSNEWTISRDTDDISIAFFVSDSGSVYYEVVNLSSYAVRPTFYLLSSVTYKSGTGVSAQNPIRIN